MFGLRLDSPQQAWHRHNRAGVFSHAVRRRAMAGGASRAVSPDRCPCGDKTAGLRWSGPLARPARPARSPASSRVRCGGRVLRWLFGRSGGWFRSGAGTVGEVAELGQVALDQPGAAGFVDRCPGDGVLPSSAVTTAGCFLVHCGSPFRSVLHSIVGCVRAPKPRSIGQVTRLFREELVRTHWATWALTRCAFRSPARERGRDAGPSTVGVRPRRRVWARSLARGTPCAAAHGVFPGGAPGRTRTCDLEIRRLLLYPAELRGPAPTAAAGNPALAA